MQPLLKLIKEMEIKMHTLMAEMQELKNTVRDMEEENTRLRRELAAAYREGCTSGTDTGDASIPGRGFFNLLELYDQGFHICNLHFGRRRSRECLFCMAFLKKELEPAAGQPEG